MENKRERTEGSYEIRNASLEDIPGIMRVQKEAWLAVYPNPSLGVTLEAVLKKDFDSVERANRWRTIIEELGTSKRLLVAKDDRGEVAGFCTLSKEGERNELMAIYILPDLQGMGIGGKLMKEALNWLGDEKDAFLHVVAYNAQAIGFYKKFGFQVTKAPVDPYQLPDGVEMPLVELVRMAKTEE